MCYGHPSLGRLATARGSKSGESSERVAVEVVLVDGQVHSPPTAQRFRSASLLANGFEPADSRFQRLADRRRRRLTSILQIAVDRASDGLEERATFERFPQEPREIVCRGIVLRRLVVVRGHDDDRRMVR